jgi:hypothetical protein
MTMTKHCNRLSSKKLTKEEKKDIKIIPDVDMRITFDK